MYGIKLNYSLVYHPQANGMVEAIKKAIVGNIRRNLEDKKGAWLEELLKVLWAQRTTKKRSTDKSPFSLVFGTEAVLPTETRYSGEPMTVSEEFGFTQGSQGMSLD